MDYKIIKQVTRVKKTGTGLLKGLMIFFGIIFLLAGIIMNRGMMLPAFLMVGLYLIYDIVSDKGYDYIMDGRNFTIDVIRGKKYRKHAHQLDLDRLIVVAPNWHQEVQKYKKNGGSEKLPKYDYTSYDDNIPFYTMIIYEEHKKIKLLLDLDENMLSQMKKMAPEKVFLQ